MTRTPPRVLIEGRPGTGKTTVARGLIERLGKANLPLFGFTTEEIREGKRRVGFSVQSTSGERGVLAHVNLPGPPKVGHYGVDLPTFERVALPPLEGTQRGTVVVIDEVGKMELASAAFRKAVERVLDSRAALVATVHVFRHPFTDRLKRRPDVEVMKVTKRNRAGLPRIIADRILEWLAEEGR